MKNNFFSTWFFYFFAVLIFYISLGLTFGLWYGNVSNTPFLLLHFKVFTWVFLFWLTVIYIHDLVRFAKLRSISDFLKRLSSAYLMSLITAIAFFYFQPDLFLTPRRFLLVLTTLSFICLCVYFVVVRWLLNRYFITEIYVLVKVKKFKEAAELLKIKFLNFKFVFVSSDQLVPAGSMFLVTDIFQLSSEEKLLLYGLVRKGCKVVRFRDLYEDIFQKVLLDDVNESWFIEQANLSTGLLFNILKRIFDLFVGFCLLPFFLLFYVVIGLASVLLRDSRGPVLFVQRRVGLGGKDFNLYKFRSMKVNSLGGWTLVNDSRITTLGYYLRKYRIDEIPQCLNLISGNLSLVGPRPEQVDLVEELRKHIPYFDDRHLVKPGLTGWAQLFVYAGNIDESKLKLEYDLFYIKHRGILLDLEIILKTAYLLITGRGK